jgi:hypothetical protein
VGERGQRRLMLLEERPRVQQRRVLHCPIGQNFGAAKNGPPSPCNKTDAS